MKITLITGQRRAVLHATRFRFHVGEPPTFGASLALCTDDDMAEWIGIHQALHVECRRGGWDFDIGQIRCTPGWVEIQETSVQPLRSREKDIRARLNAAYRWPWRDDMNARKIRDAAGDTFCRLEHRPGPEPGIEPEEVASDRRAWDASKDLILHAPADLAYLLARVEMLESLLDRQ